ncbi:MAG: Lrp/AsnC family transcriptional regulator [Euryarchaeota archaeon]|nr:Lrp/AsnC family transcriptional regulator [Euryarchaeota archaeon]MDE1836304.1 Lrp/AsnC family transcriptional regulator [Euryarchaeota archaeon]MDE1879102.1 Lrp/AsnC family transcriptional regulator [Euryarchaeota archaeon]MDE2044300.1 Lrp/AsnC family transcriptional regulator [Thermoplasmata archaeon]
MTDLDALDRTLLEELNVDARRSHRELARRLNVSPTTVSHRIEAMEHEGLIRGYVPLLEDEPLGWDLHAVVGIRVSKGRLREVEERLAKDDHAYAVYDVTGDYDALVIARFRDRRDLDRWVKHALQDPNIERTNTQVILNRVKEERRVPLPPRPKRTPAPS